MLHSIFDILHFIFYILVKLNNEYIGLSSVNTPGFANERLFFASIDIVGGDDNKIETITDNITGSLRKINGTVTVATANTTGNQHALSINDKFKLNITSNQTQTS